MRHGLAVVDRKAVATGVVLAAQPRRVRLIEHAHMAAMLQIQWVAFLKPVAASRRQSPSARHLARSMTGLWHPA